VQRRGRSGCATTVLIVGALASVSVLLIVILVIAGVFAAANKVTSAAKKADQALTAQPGRPAGYNGPSYPGMITLDHVANGAGQVEDFGFTVTASNLKRTAGDVGQQLVCADVTYLNRNSTAADYTLLADWKLQEPNGVVSLSNPVEFPVVPLTGTPSGQLIAGASTSGHVCFDDTGQHGEFVLIWHPLFNLRPDRGIWLFTLP